MPFFTRLDKLSLGVMQVDVKTSEAVPTNEFINVTVDGVANIKISSDPELLKRAAEALLGKTRQEMVTLVTQVLEHPCLRQGSPDRPASRSSLRRVRHQRRLRQQARRP